VGAKRGGGEQRRTPWDLPMQIIKVSQLGGAQRRSKRKRIKKNGGGGTPGNRGKMRFLPQKCEAKKTNLKGGDEGASAKRQMPGGGRLVYEYKEGYERGGGRKEKVGSRGKSRSKQGWTTVSKQKNKDGGKK